MLKLMEHREVIRHSQHAFTEAKSCLSYPVTFCDGVTASGDKGRARDVICLDFCQAFAMVLHKILAAKLERYDSIDELLDG